MKMPSNAGGEITLDNAGTIIDIWSWTRVPAAELDVETLIAARKTALSDREARRELDEHYAALPLQPTGDQARIAGLAFWMRGMYAQAYPLLKQGPVHSGTAYALAECCLFGGYSSYDGVVYRPDEAAETLLAVKQRSAHHTTLLLRALWAGNRIDEARKILDGASKEFQGSADGLYFAACLKELDGDHDGAETLYEQALEVNPDHTATIFRRAYRFDLSGDDEDAIDLYELLSYQRPPDVNALLNLGVLYEDNDRFEEAVRCYKSVLAAYPQHPRALLYLKDASASLDMYFDEEMEVRNDKKNQILKIPVSDFELSVRSRNCLAKMNIVSLADLVRHTEAELLAYKNFGETSLHEIKQILDAKGLRLGMKPGDELSPVKKSTSSSVNPVAPVARPATGQAPPTFAVDPNDERLKRSVGDLNLSVRSRKCLANLNVKSIGELVQFTSDDLLSQRNFGVTSLNEIKEQLLQMGLDLRTVDK
jgi:DNA-directed RNA polymerase subunit alpha